MGKKKPGLPDRLMDLYQRLLQEQGHRNWWPADSALEVMVGAVLTQNTAWKNVAQAIGNLKQARLLSPKKLINLPREELAQYIKPAGYYNLKARRLGNLLDLVKNNYRGQPGRMAKTPTQELRKELLAVKGVGPETADSILCYAFGRPVFVIDAYTFRILERHGLAEAPYDYHALQDLFHESLPHDPALFNDFHAQLVRLGHLYCKPKKPLCEQCPAQDW